MIGDVIGNNDDKEEVIGEIELKEERGGERVCQ